MNETNNTQIKNNFHFNASATRAALNVNNFYFTQGDTAGDVEPVRMTKDTSITGPDRMTKDTSITQPDRMTKDTSITDRVQDKAEDGETSGLEFANNFYWNGGLSGSVENNFYFGQEEAQADRMTKDTSITTPSRATDTGQSTGDPAELPDEPNVDHQHIK